MQEAFARAITSGVDIEAEPWLKTVAKRVAIDKVRRRHEYASGAPVELEGYMRDHDGDPQEAFVRAERSAEVRKALAALPKRYQEALMTYAEEDSPAAVATRLGLSANAAWTLLSRARSRLRLQLEHIGYAPAMWLSRVRWRGLAIGGAAAGLAAAAAVSPIVAHRSAPAADAKAPAAIVQTVDAAHAATAPAKGIVPTVKVPLLPVAAPNVAVPNVSTPPAVQNVVSACIGTPKLPVASVAITAPTTGKGLLAQVTKVLPPVNVGSKLCGK